MTSTQRASNWRLPVAIAAICIAAAGYYAFGMKTSKPKVRDNIEVTITDVDVPNSRLKADFVHPKDGKTYPVVAKIDDTCDITIDGAAAKLADLEVGDRAIGKGSLHNGVVQALAIRVTRHKRPKMADSKGDAVDGSTDPGR